LVPFPGSHFLSISEAFPVVFVLLASRKLFLAPYARRTWFLRSHRPKPLFPFARRTGSLFSVWFPLSLLLVFLIALRNLTKTLTRRPRRAFGRKLSRLPRPRHVTCTGPFLVKTPPFWCPRRVALVVRPVPRCGFPRTTFFSVSPMCFPGLLLGSVFSLLTYMIHRMAKSRFPCTFQDSPPLPFDD